MAALSRLPLKVIGAIVAPLEPIFDLSAFEELLDAAPVILFDSRVDINAPFVGNDNHRSVSVMVDYLCRIGETPVYFDIPHVRRNSAERADSYAETMRRLGHEPITVESGLAYSWESKRLGHESMDMLLTRVEAARRYTDAVFGKDDAPKGLRTEDPFDLYDWVLKVCGDMARGQVVQYLKRNPPALAAIEGGSLDAARRRLARELTKTIWARDGSSGTAG